MIGNEQHRNIIHEMYTFFCENVYDVSFFNFDNIYISYNIIEDLPDYGVYEKTFLISGCVILPNEIIDEPIIVIDVSSDDLLNISESVFHELIHMYDYKQFADTYTNGSFINLHKHELCSTLKAYSEFHASANCSIYPIKFMNVKYGIFDYDEYISTHFIQFLEEYVSKKNDLLVNHCLSLYDLLQLFGKLYCLDLYRQVDDVNNSCVYHYLPEIFHSDSIYQMYDLYKILFENIENQTILDNLIELKNVIELSTRSF